MQKWIMFVIFIGASVLGLYLMTFGLPEKPVDEAAELPPGVSLLKIQASNFHFDQDEYKVAASDKVKVVLENKQGIHGIEIKGLDVHLDMNNPEAEIDLSQPGEYEIHCSIPCGEGHLDMVSKLIVE
ncbi:cytochrome C oxidase subunit II [Paenibacillus abyssi]|uniref:Cytochrome C oxidase subunit II n=1 Tax=Paenibacillus abyssi TaxID=1340531 RepID=A0A917G046_9BACL|nr:cytochrome C oxidase subunit II [Paenibacillus abyssi]GGG15832.1 hypothetical protein GCM10010916_35960 [Paenibacillus abyssi]